MYKLLQNADQRSADPSVITIKYDYQLAIELYLLMIML
ncbi:MAG: hypothetical protein ACI9IJ_001975, partial [Psychromonas sp.]